MIWTSGLLIWFFGLYSFIEKEIEGAYKRLLLLKSLENEEDIHKRVEVIQAIRAQKAVLQALSGDYYRIFLIHLPGILIGTTAPLPIFFLLLYQIFSPLPVTYTDFL